MNVPGALIRSYLITPKLPFDMGLVGRVPVAFLLELNAGRVLQIQHPSHGNGLVQLLDCTLSCTLSCTSLVRQKLALGLQ